LSILIQTLNHIPFAGLMLVVALGYLLGRVGRRGIALGPAGGTVLVALALGAAGLDFHSLYGSTTPAMTIGGFGFALFIYSVGFEAGPRFFSGTSLTFRFILIGLTVNLLALLTAILAGRFFGLPSAVTAGVLAGATTSAATYAGAAEVAADGAALAVSFALTYPLGLVGVVLLVQFLPRLMGDELKGDASYEEPSDGEVQSKSPELRRVFEVSADSQVVGRTLRELELTRRTGCVITQIHYGGGFSVPGPDTRLETRDHVMVKGLLAGLREFEELVGPEVYDDGLRRSIPSPRAIQVTSRRINGRTLRQLELVTRFNCLITDVLRGGVTLEPKADLPLFRDDIVLVSGSNDDVLKVAQELGRFERSSSETDIAIYAGGILLGVLLGQAHLEFIGFDMRVGDAVGLLIVGVLLGRFRKIGRWSAHVPNAARRLVRDLGILLFVGETGVIAGGSSLEGLHHSLWQTLATGALVTVIPVMGAAFVGRLLFRLRPVEVWGSVGGGMTSSAALAAVRSAANDSNEPAISYAASFAVSAVIATLAGRLIILAM
jgi:putative transport protein